MTSPSLTFFSVYMHGFQRNSKHTEQNTGRLSYLSKTRVIFMPRGIETKQLFEACNFIKKEALAQVFSCEFCEISKNTFSYKTPTVATSVLLLFCFTNKTILLIIESTIQSFLASEYFNNVFNSCRKLNKCLVNHVLFWCLCSQFGLCYVEKFFDWIYVRTPGWYGKMLSPKVIKSFLAVADVCLGSPSWRNSPPS